MPDLCWLFLLFLLSDSLSALRVSVFVSTAVGEVAWG